MKVIIAEKPSVAKSIAAIVGATTKREGYLEGGGYAVTWAFGHLVGLAMPEAYGITGFRRENLPILPPQFKLVPRQIKQGKEYKDDPGALKQLKIIKELFGKAEGIVVATDAGREGELIFRHIYTYLGCTKPFERLWISSLTDRAIREGLQNLRPGSEYDNLYLSAKARSEADWVVGINASQALSITAGYGVWSLGRVQTPTLAMICSRYLENRDFQPQTYFRLKLHTDKDATAFAVLSAEKYDTRAAADEALQKIKADGSLRVTSVEKREVRQQPPLLCDLTALQKEANSRYGFSADKTLSLAQKLYEAKLISYPRTGSRYICADVLEEIPHLIASLKNHPRFGTYAASMEGQQLNTRSVDDKKVTDHHALIITGEAAKGLSADEETIYELIAGRMLEAFSEACVKENTDVRLEAAGVPFACKGSVTLHPGWRAVCGAMPEEAPEDDFIPLPALTENDTLPIREAETLEKQTLPRPLHTEASLLGAMESAGKECNNEEEREAMKEAGIGTPATRAAIIETLFAREYIVREPTTSREQSSSLELPRREGGRRSQKKNLVPTNKGLTVYLAVKDKKIADVAMTGQWELVLSKIASGEMNADTFHRGIEVYAAQVTKELLSVQIGAQERPGATCPRCGQPVVFYPQVARCQNPDCSLIAYRTIAKKELTDAQLADLFNKGKTELIQGFKSRLGKTFDAFVIFDDKFHVIFDFPPRKAEKQQKGSSGK